MTKHGVSNNAHNSVFRLVNCEQVPYKVREIFLKSQPAFIQDQNLWRAVVATAVLDACGLTGLKRNTNAHNETIRDAIEWFHFGDDITGEYGPTGSCDLGEIDSYIVKIMKEEFPLSLIEELEENERTETSNN